MLKYKDVMVTFTEVPNEITLCINIAGCPIHCTECHSKWLWEDEGTPLTNEELKTLIESHDGVTCIGFMGGDNSPIDVNELAAFVREQFPEIKIAWYSGKERLSNGIDLQNFDFIKLGPYIGEFGGLESKYTNQIFYKVYKRDDRYYMQDITSEFWDD